MHIGFRHIALVFGGTALALMATAGAFPDGTSSLLPVPGRAEDSSNVAASVVGFSAALVAGDSAAVLSLLADDVVILESGGGETRAEYRSSHLSADIAFAQAVRSHRGPANVRVRGDVAWATTNSTTEGIYRGRSINSVSVELMVLTREPAGWKVRAVHWSSHARRSPR